MNVPPAPAAPASVRPVLAIAAFANFSSSLFMRAIDPLVPQVAIDLSTDPATVALLTTAFGLATAIPAVVIYNYFARMVASYKVSVADGSAEVLRLVSRDLDFQYRSLMAAQPAA